MSYAIQNAFGHYLTTDRPRGPPRPLEVMLRRGGNVVALDDAFHLATPAHRQPVLFAGLFATDGAI